MKCMNIPKKHVEEHPYFSESLLQQMEWLSDSFSFKTNLL